VTPRRRLIELSADGRDYLVIADEESDELRPLEEVLCKLMESFVTKQTRAQIESSWPTDHPKPPATTLWRLLERLVARGALKRDGAGQKSDPYYYWLPSLEERWKTDVVAALQQRIQDTGRSLHLGPSF
jgi:hypothetical protein